MPDPASPPTRSPTSPFDSRRRHVPSTAGYVVAHALLVCGGALLLSAAVTAFDGGRALLPLAGMAAVCAAMGFGLRRLCEPPQTLPARSVHGAVLLGWLVLLAVGTVAYVVTGTTDGIGTAALESTAGFTTTARTVLQDLEQLPRGVLLWRASTQWIGGFAALIVVVGVLPTLGVGGLSGTVVEADRRRLHLRSPRIVTAVRRLAIAYASLSAVGVLLFLLAGMKPFDAITYAMTTISTGGFGNYPGSVSYFDSALIEWVTAGGMALGGVNLALVLSLVRGDPRPLWRSAELRAYLGLIAIATVVLGTWLAPIEGGAVTSVRRSLFATTSAISTTGHTLDSWSSWPDGPWVVLVLLAAMGAMAGAAGGGFRVVRAMVMVSLIFRETRSQLHPRSVIAVKVGREPVPESTVAHMVGYQVAWVSLAGIGAVGLALSGLDLRSAMTGATSALATWGPGLGELVPGAVASNATVAVMAPLMLAGRLEISPVVVGLGTVFRSLTRRDPMPRSPTGARR